MFADLPGSFQSALHGALTGKDYVSGVRTTIRVGGCNASRGGFVGACMAAQVSRGVLKVFLDVVDCAGRGDYNFGAEVG